jgi:hypothetical protein
MELRRFLDRLALIDGAVLSTIRVVAVEDAGNDGLGYHAPTLVIYQGGVEQMQIGNLETVQQLQIAEIAIGRRDRRRRIHAALLLQINRKAYPKVLWRFHRVAEENVVVDVDLLQLGVHGIQRLDDLIHDSHSSLDGRVQEITMDLHQGLITIDLLDEVSPRQVPEYLDI